MRTAAAEPEYASRKRPAAYMWRRHMSAALVPAFCSFTIAMICSSENLDAEIIESPDIARGFKPLASTNGKKAYKGCPFPIPLPLT
ncbi:hypothetical protein GGR49_003812 [Sphingomonas carotinifaciens]|nr:hypothetical protein [Sphingomonas carotinifaciens]